MILTMVISVVLILACVKTYGELVPFCIVLALCLMLIIPALFYAPLSVRANERCIIISSLLKKHHISLNDIVRVEPFTPTMGPGACSVPAVSLATGAYSRRAMSAAMPHISEKHLIAFLSV